MNMCFIVFYFVSGITQHELQCFTLHLLQYPIKINICVQYNQILCVRIYYIVQVQFHRNKALLFLKINYITGVRIDDWTDVAIVHSMYGVGRENEVIIKVRLSPDSSAPSCREQLQVAAVIRGRQPATLYWIAFSSSTSSTPTPSL